MNLDTPFIVLNGGTDGLVIPILQWENQHQDYNRSCSSLNSGQLLYVQLLQVVQDQLQSWNPVSGQHEFPAF
jgi:hypothetical protein